MVRTIYGGKKLCAGVPEQSCHENNGEKLKMRLCKRYGKMNEQKITMYIRHILPLKFMVVWLSVAILFVVGQLFFLPCAQAGSYEEYQVKAAFLHKFAKFVEWPSGAFSSDADPFMLCVAGKDPFGKALDTLHDKTVGNRKIVVRKFQSTEDAGKCHILFIGSSEKSGLQQILKAVRNKQILTVGDTEGFAQSGVMINFTLQEGKVQFEINPQAVKQAGLTVSSQLLKVSKIIGEGK
jgi:hypothetical protein